MDHVKKATEVLKDGGIVIFPTDTAFGIGCRIDDEAAVKRLFAVRRRPEEKAPPVLVGSLEMAQAYLQPVSQDVIDQLVKPFWPGALTIVLQCQVDKVLPMVRKNDTLGVRVPDHATTLAMINGLGVPIIGSSANFPSEKTPYNFEDLDPELVKLVDYVVPGTCKAQLASTVIDVTQKPWKILRQGPIQI
jgi:L-threonylcarbamoyladenylate synthase